MSVSTPSGIAIGDLDGVNGNDLAIGSAQAIAATAPNAFLMLHDTSGGWSNVVPLQIQYPQAVAIGDVNNDGVREAVFVQDYPNVDPDGSVVINSTGRTLFTINQGNGASSVAIGQLNNYADNDLDYAVADPGTNDVTVNYWDPTRSSFRTVSYNTLTNISALTIGRVGRDSLYDIIGVSATTGVVILEGNMIAGFSAPQNYPAGPNPSGVVGGDFNRDGLFDVMVLNPGNSSASLLIANPQSGFFPPITLSLPNNPTSFVVADFDGDGRQDVAITVAGAPSVVLLYSNGYRL